MKSIIYFALTMLFALSFFSCSEDNVMLYHDKEEPIEPPKPVDVWLLTQVSHTKEGTLPYSRSDIALFYDGEDRINEFGNVGAVTNTAIQYLDNGIIITKSSTSGNVSTYDTIHIAFNAQKQAKYAVHTTYSKRSLASGERVDLTNLDSTVFVYGSEDYLTQMIHYKIRNNEYYVSYEETFSVNAGNVTEMINNAGERYTYTYNQEDHKHESEFCHEMPRNVNSAYSKCWTLQLLPIISDYLGKKSKNNVSSVNIEYPQGTSISNKYTKIIYDYIYDDNQLMDRAKMSGLISGNTPFDNSIMTFTHTKK